MQAIYNLPLNDRSAQRVSGYRFTVKTKDDTNLINLKKNIRIQNNYVKNNSFDWYTDLGASATLNETDRLKDMLKFYRVSLYGRGPRRWHTWLAENHPELVGLPEKDLADNLLHFKRFMQKDYDKLHSKYLHWNCDSNLRHQFANRFDVYVNRDYQREDVWYKYLTTGMTPAQQRKVSNLEYQILCEKTQARQNKKEMYND